MAPIQKSCRILTKDIILKMYTFHTNSFRNFVVTYQSHKGTENVINLYETASNPKEHQFTQTRK